MGESEFDRKFEGTIKIYLPSRKRPLYEAGLSPTEVRLLLQKNAAIVAQFLCPRLEIQFTNPFRIRKYLQHALDLWFVVYKTTEFHQSSFSEIPTRRTIGT